MKVKIYWLLKHFGIAFFLLNFTMLQNYPPYLTPGAIASLVNILEKNELRLQVEYQNAMAWADSNNISIIETDESGEIILRLVGIRNGKPIYHSFTNQNVAKTISTVMAQDVRVTGNYEDKKQRPIPEAQVEYYRGAIAYSYATTTNTGGFELWSPPLANDPEIIVNRGNFTSHNWAEPMSTMTQFYTQVEDEGTITITNLIGQYVASAPLEGMRAHYIQWGGKDINGISVANGIYFYTVHAGNYQQTGSIILLKNSTPTGGLTVIPQQYGSVQIAEKLIMDFQQEPHNDPRALHKNANQDVQVSENGTIYRNIQEHTGEAGNEFEETDPDSVIFTKPNTTRLFYIMDPPETPVDLGTIAGNIGPTHSEIPTQEITIGNIVLTNLNTYVDNDESFSIYTPREADFVMANDSIVSFYRDMTGLYETWIDIVDSTDINLTDSLMYTVLVTDNLPPTINLPDTMIVYEGTEGTALIEDLREYRTDSDTDEVTFGITEHPIPELIILSIAGYSMNIDHILEDVQAYDAVTVSITDGVYTTLDTMILQVMDVNNSPIVVAQPPNFVMMGGESLIIPGISYITDADDVLTYQLLNLSNGTQTTANGQVTFTPTQGYAGDITGVMLQGSDEEFDVQTNPFNITVQPIPTSQLTIIQRDFYTQTTITSDTSWFWIRQLSPYEWTQDSVYYSLDGILNVELPFGDYEINTTAANTCDGAEWWTAESYLGLTREGDLKPFSKIGGQGGRCEFTLDQAADLLYANKVMLDFSFGSVVSYMGGVIVAFGDNSQDAPFVWDLNYEAPDAGELVWTNEYIAMIQERQFNTLTMPILQTTDIPTEPHTEDASGGEFPPPGSNGTVYNPTTYEIVASYASFYPGFSKYTFFIENIQAQYRIIDHGGEDPPVFQWDGNGGLELNELGNQFVDFSDFWGAGYFVSLPALALYVEDQIKDGNTSIASQIMGSDQYRTSVSATVKDFPGLSDYLKKFPIESRDPDN